MKTLYNITTAVLVLCTVSAFASDDKEKDNKKTGKETTRIVKWPAFIWGEPQFAKMSEPVKSTKVTFPEFVWGGAPNVYISDEAPKAKVSFPEFQWGDPSEAISASVNALKVQFPAFEWGNPEQID